MGAKEGSHKRYFHSIIMSCIFIIRPTDYIAVKVICKFVIFIKFSAVQMAERSKIDDLRKQLEAFNMTRHMQLPELPDIAVITERIIQHHIEQSINAAVEITTIRDQLRELNDDSIISSQLYTWALKEVDKFAVTESVMPATSKHKT